MFSSKFLICLTLGIVLLIVNPCEAQRKRTKPLPECHWEGMDECIKPLFYFSHRPNTTGLALNRREHALLCRSIKNVTDCVQDFFTQCGTALSQEMFVLVNEVYVNNVKPFCRNGDTKNNYLEHARCVNNVQLTQQFRRKCVSRFQATLESMEEQVDYSNRIGLACCGYRAWLDCSTESVKEECQPGDNAAQAFLDYFNAFTGGVPRYVCQPKKYDPESKFCRKVLPTVRRRPKGRNSDNVFSKYFSLFYPNIGF